MRARLYDPEGTPYLRAVVPSAFGLTFACALLTGFTDSMLPGIAAAAFALVIYLSPLFERRLAPRDVDLDVTPGRVAFRDYGVMRVLSPRLVAGATASHADGKPTLVLDAGERGSPIAFALTENADVHTLTHALGIGDHGHGSVTWWTSRGAGARIYVATRIAWRVLLPLGYLAFRAGLEVIGGLCLIVASVAGMLALALRVARPPIGPHLTLAQRGLELVGPLRGSDSDTLTIPYDRVAKAVATPTSIDVVLTGDGGTVGVPTDAVACPPERSAQIVAQINAAAERARVPAYYPERELEERLALLRRGDDSDDAWFARVDAAASALRGGGPTYRSSAVDEADLWSAVENPDVSAEIRVAAARVLVHADPSARARVEAAAATIRNGSEARRLRVAIETEAETPRDADEATRHGSAG